MKIDNNNLLRVDGTTFLALPVTDTSVGLAVHSITDFESVKTKLLRLYGDVKVVADGAEKLLSELASAAEISVAPQPDFAKQRYNVTDAMRVIARLTREDGGCPWDKAQTHDSIRINMIEEAYEAVDAIESRDIANMREEFGDVFLQSILQSDIARRSGEFDFDDVCDELCKKLIGRHTFIFGDDSAGNPDEALTLWEKAKATEKHYNSVKAQLERLPQNFPALLLAEKTHKKLKKAGAPSDPQAELAAAVKAEDYAAAIAACAALLAESGLDAEVELNRLIKKRISDI